MGTHPIGATLRIALHAEVQKEKKRLFEEAQLAKQRQEKETQKKVPTETPPLEKSS